MNWLTAQRRFRFNLRTLLIAFSVVAICASAYLVGREFGAKEGFKLGYAHGVQVADEALKAKVKEATTTWNYYAHELQNAEREIAVLKLEAKKKSSPTP